MLDSTAPRHRGSAFSAWLLSAGVPCLSSSPSLSGIRKLSRKITETLAAAVVAGRPAAFGSENSDPHHRCLVGGLSSYFTLINGRCLSLSW
ncbi:unnamed protein product [Victoria cruziana]